MLEQFLDEAARFYKASERFGHGRRERELGLAGAERKNARREWSCCGSIR